MVRDGRLEAVGDPVTTLKLMLQALKDARAAKEIVDQLEAALRREEVERMREALRAARRCIRAHHRSGESLGDRLCPVCIADTTDYGYEYHPDREQVERAVAALEGSDG